MKKETRIRRDKTNIPYNLDLRQEDAWEYYTDRRSDTYNNAYKSAIKAGYAESTAKNIMLENWWAKKVEQLLVALPRAEEVLLEDLNMETSVIITKGGGVDEDGEEMETITIKKIDPMLRRLRQDSAKFIAETIGRKKYHKKFEMETNENISLVDGNPIFDNLFRKSKQNKK